MLAGFIPALSCVLLTCCTTKPAGEDEAAKAATAVERDSCVNPPHVPRDPEGWLEVWVDLSEPPLNALDKSEHDAQRTRIQAQQNDVMTALNALGARELARVIIVRNALAVCLPSRALEDARGLQGVVKVRPVKHRQRTP